jgi:lysophospholipase L1-like esterase
MSYSSNLRLAVSIVAIALSILLGDWASLPRHVMLELGLIGAFLVWAQVRAESASSKLAKWLLTGAYVTSIPALATMLFGFHNADYFYGLLALLIASALFVLETRQPEKRRLHSWTMLGWVWAAAAVAVCVLTAYERNERFVFFASLTGGLALLVMSKRLFRLPTAGIHLVNTLLMLLVGLPVADCLLFPADHLNAIPKVETRPYSYAAFQRDPAAYDRWWNYYQQQLRGMYRTMFLPSSTPDLLFVLRSNVQGNFCDSQFRINRRGFRGAEILLEKGNAYRIVALGESTTFGITVAADARTWPVWLEETIRERLHPDRPVEVINAGIPSYALKDNLARLAEQILPLQPDMIISYHGHNEFGAIDTALPPVRTRKAPPRYVRRPLKLLADSEYRLKMIEYQRAIGMVKDHLPVATEKPMDTAYADDYRTLIEFSRSNHIRLALATYSMAVNADSAPDVRSFYQRTTSLLARKIKANVVHTFIVKELAHANRDVCFVDTLPALDGRSDYYIDLAHFSAAGKQRLAETMFAGIRATLERELATGP